MPRERRVALLQFANPVQPGLRRRPPTNTIPRRCLDDGGEFPIRVLMATSCRPVMSAECPQAGQEKCRLIWVNKGSDRRFLGRRHRVSLRLRLVKRRFVGRARSRSANGELREEWIQIGSAKHHKNRLATPVRRTYEISCTAGRK
jgi:hypothetical protein